MALTSGQAGGAAGGEVGGGTTAPGPGAGVRGAAKRLGARLQK